MTSSSWLVGRLHMESPLTVTQQLAELLHEFHASVAAAQQRQKHVLDQCRAGSTDAAAQQDSVRLASTPAAQVDGDMALEEMQGVACHQIGNHPRQQQACSANS